MTKAFGRVALLLTLLSVVCLILAGCSGDTGPQGIQGPPGDPGTPGDPGDPGDPGTPATGTIAGVTHDLLGDATNAPGVYAVWTGPLTYEGTRPTDADKILEATPQALGDFVIEDVAPGEYTVYAAITYNGVQYRDTTRGTATLVKVYPDQTTTLPDPLVAPEAFAATSFESNGAVSGDYFIVQPTISYAWWKFDLPVNITDAQFWSRMNGAVSGTHHVSMTPYWLLANDDFGTAGSGFTYDFSTGTTIDDDSPEDLDARLPSPGINDVPTKAGIRIVGHGSGHANCLVNQGSAWVVEALGTIAYTIETP